MDLFRRHVKTTTTANFMKKIAHEKMLEEAKHLNVMVQDAMDVLAVTLDEKSKAVHHRASVLELGLQTKVTASAEDAAEIDRLQAELERLVVSQERTKEAHAALEAELADKLVVVERLSAQREAELADQLVGLERMSAHRIAELEGKCEEMARAMAEGQASAMEVQEALQKRKRELGLEVMRLEQQVAGLAADGELLQTRLRSLRKSLAVDDEGAPRLKALLGERERQLDAAATTAKDVDGRHHFGAEPERCLLDPTKTPAP